MIASGTLLSGKYRIEKPLGRGGSGIVYAARQEPLGRPVALKILRADLVSSSAFIERFRREAEAAAALQHPNLVQVTDLVTDGEHVFLVMERLVGASLAATILKDGPLAQDRLATIGSEVLAGLAVAHAAGLVHRDVKPDNVFLLSPGEEDESAKLLDFGIVKRSNDDEQLTEGVIGTWQYMPPEQSRGITVDGRADIYSLGASLYCAATGQRPHQAADMDRMTFVISPVHAPALATLRKDFDPAFCAVIDRALAKDIADRWPSAIAMRAAFAPFTRRRLPGKTRGTVRLADAPRPVLQRVAAVATDRAPAALDEDTATIPSKSSSARDEPTMSASEEPTTAQGIARHEDDGPTLDGTPNDDDLSTVRKPAIDFAKLALPPAVAPTPPHATAMPAPPSRSQALTVPVRRSRTPSLLIALVAFACFAGLVAAAIYVMLGTSAPR